MPSRTVNASPDALERNEVEVRWTSRGVTVTTEDPKSTLRFPIEYDAHGTPKHPRAGAPCTGFEVELDAAALDLLIAALVEAREAVHPLPAGAAD